MCSALEDKNVIRELLARLVACGGDRREIGVAGRYHDRLRGVGDRWLFAERTAHLVFVNRPA